MKLDIRIQECFFFLSRLLFKKKNLPIGHIYVKILIYSKYQFRKIVS